MRKLKLTQTRRERFLKALADTGSVTTAVAAAGTSRTRVYELRKVDPAFAAAWAEAEDIAADRLADEARRRAMEGVPIPLVSAGKLVRDVAEGTITPAEAGELSRLVETYIKALHAQSASQTTGDAISRYNTDELNEARQRNTDCHSGRDGAAARSGGLRCVAARPGLRTGRMTDVDAAKLPVMLNTLRLPTIGRLWQEFGARADREGWGSARFLAALCEHELADRATRRIARHLAESGLPQGKTFATLDFAAVPTIRKAHVMALANGDAWLEGGGNLLIFGASMMLVLPLSLALATPRSGPNRMAMRGGIRSIMRSTAAGRRCETAWCTCPRRRGSGWNWTGAGWRIVGNKSASLNPVL